MGSIDVESERGMKSVDIHIIPMNLVQRGALVNLDQDYLHGRETNNNDNLWRVLHWSPLLSYTRVHCLDWLFTASSKEKT